MCEPARCSAYSSDFRWRMVWQTEALGLSSEQVIRPQLSSGAHVTIAWVRMRPALWEPALQERRCNVRARVRLRAMTF